MKTCESFSLLLKRLSPTLKRITYRLGGHYSSFGDEDLFQEALVHLWQDFGKGRLSDKTDSYILQGCYFHLKNYIRGQKVFRNFVSLDEGVSADDERLVRSLQLEDEHAARFHDELHVKMLAETLHNNGFTPREKEVLRFLSDGLTTRQIGKRMGVSHVRVVRMMAVIREKSKEYLD